MIKVENGTASRAPIPKFLRGLKPESLLDLSWTDPALGVQSVAWYPEVDQSPPLGQFEQYGAETLTIDEANKRVIVTRETVPWSSEEIAQYQAVQDAAKRRQAKDKALDLIIPKQIASELDTLPDEDVAELAYLYDEWSGDGVAYAIDDIVRVGDVPYRVIQAHTSQADWTPATAASLFTPLRTVTGPNPDPWVQPTGAQDAYAIDALVTHNGSTWKSLVDANVWEPGAVGSDALWEVVV